METTTLTIHDYTMTGICENALTLDFPSAIITARELIRKRIYEEVREYNTSTPRFVRPLVQPGTTERNRNGAPTGEGPRMDWEEQAERALEMFQHSRYYLLVNDRQVASLDEKIELRTDTEICFLNMLSK